MKVPDGSHEWAMPARIHVQDFVVFTIKQTVFCTKPLEALFYLIFDEKKV